MCIGNNNEKASKLNSNKKRQIAKKYKIVYSPNKQNQLTTIAQSNPQKSRKLNIKTMENVFSVHIL